MTTFKSIRVGTCDGRYGVYIEQLVKGGSWSYSIRRYSAEMACGGAWNTKDGAKAKALEASVDLERRLAEVRNRALSAAAPLTGNGEGEG